MSKLICDICGTSYSDGVDKCPTCGYARAFEEPGSDAAQLPVVREKVRGGRFSRKNVRKRLEMLAKAEQKSQEAVSAVEMAEELTAIVGAAAAEIPAEPVPAEEPVVVELSEEEAPAQEAAAEIPAETVPAEEPVVIELLAEEAPVQEAAEEIPAETVSEEEAVVVIPPVEAPEQTADVQTAQENVPEQELDPIMILEKVLEMEEITEESQESEVEEISIPALIPAEEPASEDAEALVLPPLVIPGDETPAAEEAQIEPEAVTGEEEKKKKGGVLLNVVLYTSLAVFLTSAIYLLVNFGIPYLKNMDWPTRPVAETTMPTEEPTQAPTDAPTEAPTDAPTEAPTDAPTEPPTEAPTDPPTEAPTEAPTEPLLDVKLELNYYDLTFGAPNQGTQLEAKTIPNEDITWISDDPSVVTISETGKIISVGGGRTTVRAIYGDQEVTVKIYCAF